MQFCEYPVSQWGKDGGTPEGLKDLQVSYFCPGKARSEYRPSNLKVDSNYYTIWFLCFMHGYKIHKLDISMHGQLFAIKFSIYCTFKYCLI